MEQRFQNVPRETAILRLILPTETVECALVGCNKRCNAKTGVLWRYYDDDTFHYRLLCSWACALEAMPREHMNRV